MAPTEFLPLGPFQLSSAGSERNEDLKHYNKKGYDNYRVVNDIQGLYPIDPPLAKDGRIFKGQFTPAIFSQTISFISFVCSDDLLVSFPLDRPSKS